MLFLLPMKVDKANPKASAGRKTVSVVTGRFSKQDSEDVSGP